MSSFYFLQMITRLRSDEEIVLYHNIRTISEEEELQVTSFLKSEYERESHGYPHSAPPFQPDAAIWAARTVYYAAQLLLYRDHRPEDIPAIITDFKGEMSAGAILSADITLRFLPEILKHLRNIEPDDKLIPLLREKLLKWHYSGLKEDFSAQDIQGGNHMEHLCVRQLYINRIIELKKTKLALSSDYKSEVLAALGMYSETYWPELKHELQLHEST